MRLAILVLAHKNPEQLCRLLRALQHPGTGVFLHLDRRCRRSDFSEAFVRHQVAPEYVVQRERVLYSSIAYVHATLDLLARALQQGYNYFSLISGQDYPLRRVASIHSFFEEHAEELFIESEPLPCTRLAYGGRTRTDYYSYPVMGRMETHFPWREVRHSMTLKGRLLNAYLWLRALGRGARVFPLGMDPYYSSQWWNIPRDAAEYVLAFVRSNPAYTRYHRHALHPEEMYFQSILLNSPAFRSRTINSNLRFIKWPEGSKHPRLLRAADVDDIKASPALFGRKLDLAVDASVFDMIDGIWGV